MKAHNGLSFIQPTQKTGQNLMNKTMMTNNTDRNCSKYKGSARVKMTGLLLLLACFFLQGHATASVTLPTVGPVEPGQNEKVSVGYLTVFSSTEETQGGDGPYYYAHTGYFIYDAAGKAVKWVANHDSNTDEAPQQVELPPGKYTIWAQSAKDGYVKVPVVIKLARTTAVHLEKGNA